MHDKRHAKSGTPLGLCNVSPSETMQLRQWSSTSRTLWRSQKWLHFGSLSLPGLFNSPNVNSDTELIVLLDDSFNLVTWLLQICPVKWQRQHDLTENSTLVSWAALLLVLENTESNMCSMASPLSKTKWKGSTTRGRWTPWIPLHTRRPGKAGQWSTVLSAINTFFLCWSL